MESILISVFSPVFVYLATKAALFFKPNVPAAIITTIIVPLFAGLAGYITTLVNPAMPWYISALASLAGVFIHEFINNIRKAIA